MQSTLKVNGVECKTVLINGLWYVIIENKPCKLYRGLRKSKKGINGKVYDYMLKGMCDVCSNKFFGLLHNQMKYCGNSCASKIRVKRTHSKHVEMVGDKALKLRSRNLIDKRIQRKRIVKPLVCSSCKCHSDVQAHHPDYSKPNEVIWLCRSCHHKLHYGNKSISGELIIYSVAM